MWGLPTNFLLHTFLQLTKCATWKAQWGSPGPTTLHGGFLEMQEGGEKNVGWTLPNNQNFVCSFTNHQHTSSSKEPNLEIYLTSLSKIWLFTRLHISNSTKITLLLSKPYVNVPVTRNASLQPTFRWQSSCSDESPSKFVTQFCLWQTGGRHQLRSSSWTNDLRVCMPPSIALSVANSEWQV